MLYQTHGENMVNNISILYVLLNTYIKITDWLNKKFMYYEYRHEIRLLKKAFYILCTMFNVKNEGLTLNLLYSIPVNGLNYKIKAFYTYDNKTIHISIPAISNYSNIEVLCHEFCHYLQYKQRKLENVDQILGYKYLGKEYPNAWNTSLKLYENFPWEIEARKFAKEYKIKVITRIIKHKSKFILFL